MPKILLDIGNGQTLLGWQLEAKDDMKVFIRGGLSVDVGKGLVPDAGPANL